MALRDYFKDQIKNNVTITEKVLPKVEYKRVWSNKLISVGDKVLYAYLQNNDGDNFLFELLERELEEFDNLFALIDMENETIPILKKVK